MTESRFIEHPLPELSPAGTVTYERFGTLGINNVLLFRSAGGGRYLLLEQRDSKDKVMIRVDELAELVALVEEAEEAEDVDEDAQDG